MHWKEDRVFLICVLSMYNQYCSCSWYGGLPLDYSLNQEYIVLRSNLNSSKTAPMAAVKQGKNKSKQKQNKRGKEWVGLPSELAGRCAACGEANHNARNCHIRKNKTACNHCGTPGHLAKVCFSALQGKPKTTRETRPQPLRAIMGPTDEIEEQEPWVHRLKLSVSHKKRIVHVSYISRHRKRCHTDSSRLGAREKYSTNQTL